MLHTTDHKTNQEQGRAVANNKDGKHGRQMPARSLTETVVQGNYPAMMDSSMDVRQQKISRENTSSIESLKKQSTLQLREKHVINRDVTPHIHEFTTQAIGNGAPERLTYLINKNSSTYVQNAEGKIFMKSAIPEGDQTQYFPIDLHSLNRNKALARGFQLHGASKNHQYGLSRDEFPYASTYEGGSDTYWAYVPAAEQSIQGAHLKNLYARVIESGDPEFDVELT